MTKYISQLEHPLACRSCLSQKFSLQCIHMYKDGETTVKAGGGGEVGGAQMLVTIGVIAYSKLGACFPRKVLHFTLSESVSDAF